MFKNALMYVYITYASTTPYTLHIDDDTHVLAKNASAWVWKAMETFVEVPKLSFLGTFQCHGGFNSVLGRIQPLAAEHCRGTHCSYSLYTDTHEGHWSLRQFMVANARFRALWP